MNNKVQIVVTAAGPPTDPFLEAGFLTPKNLVSFENQTILSKIVSVYDHSLFETRVAILQSELSAFPYVKSFEHIEHKPEVVPIFAQTHGALCTALLSIDYGKKEHHLIIAPGDSATLIESIPAISTFIKDDIDVGTIVYPSDEQNRSYVRIGGNGQILEIAERRVISNYATTGLFYFKNIDLFLQGAEWALTNSINFKSNYFISHSIHKHLADGKTTQVYKLQQPENYISLRNPAEVIKRWEKNA